MTLASKSEIEREKLPQARVEGIAEAVTEEVEGQHGDENGDPGEEAEPRRVSQVLAARGEHHAPVGIWRLRAKPNETEPGGVNNRLPNGKRGEDDDRCPGVRQHVTDEDSAGRLAHCPRGLNVLLLLDGEDR